jgi:2,5-diketo-D-gluconate reductase A
VTLRWLVQRGIIPIPITSDTGHMKENLDVFDFELSAAEMDRIATLDIKTTRFPEWD